MSYSTVYLLRQIMSILLLLLVSLVGQSNLEIITSTNEIREIKIFEKSLTVAIASSFNSSATSLSISVRTNSKKHQLFFENLLNRFLDENNYWNFTTQLQSNIEKSKIHIGEYNLWLIESQKEFCQLFSSMMSKNKNDNQIYFLIVLKTHSNFKEIMQQSFSKMFQSSLAHVAIIAQTASGEISAFTYFPYKFSNCGSTTPIIIHNFTSGNGLLFPSKAENVKGCVLKIVSRNPVLVKRRPLYRFKEGNELWAIDLEIISVLSKLMNFNYEIVDSPITEIFTVFDNGTALGPFKTLQEGKADILIGLYKNGFPQNKYFTPSVSYFNTWTVIVLIHPISDFLEIFWMFNAFDIFAWISILLTLSVGAVLTKIRRRYSDIKIFDMLAVTIGISISSFPRKFSLRWCLISWTISAMVLRNAYQGKLFDSYRRQTTSGKLTNIKELMAQNFIIYTHRLYESIIIDQFDKLDKPVFKFLTAEKILTNDNSIDKKAAVASFIYFYIVYDHSDLEKFIMKRIYGEHVTMFFRKQSILTPKVNRIIRWMDEAGLLLLWRSEYEYLTRINFGLKPSIVEAPKLLKFHRFKGVLLMFGVLYLVAFGVFLSELWWNLNGNLLRTRKLRKESVEFVA